MDMNALREGSLLSGATKNKSGATATAAPGPLREQGARFSRRSKGLSSRLGNQADLTLGKRHVKNQEKRTASNSLS